MSSHHRKFGEFIEDAEARQRNIVFPNTVRNGRSADAFLWKGSPRPTIVQRLGAWIVGLWFTGIGLACLYALPRIKHTGDFLLGVVGFVVMGLGGLYVGGRIFRNGFPRKQSSKTL